MDTESTTLAVLCSVHVAICLAIAALVFLPIAGPKGSAVLGALSAFAFAVARRISRAYHRSRRAVALSSAPAGD